MKKIICLQQILSYLLQQDMKVSTKLINTEPYSSTKVKVY